MPSSLFNAGSAGANSPTAIQSGPAVCESGCAPQQPVGRERLSRAEIHGLSDAQLETYIRICIDRQNGAQGRFSAPGGTFADAAERDQWLMAEHEARDHKTVRAELKGSK